MAKVIDTFKEYHAKDRAAWRKWLEKNHAKEEGVWLIYYKKDSGKESCSCKKDCKACGEIKIRP